MGKNILFLIVLSIIAIIQPTPLVGLFARDITAVVPSPKTVISKNIEIILGKNWRIVVNASDRNNLKCAEYLRKKFVDKFSLNLPIENYQKEVLEKKIFLGTSNESFIKEILISRGIVMPQEIKREGYVLDISHDSILIVANEPNGIFYGIGSLLQLIYSKQDELIVPGLQMTDYPDINMRGVHFLDVDFENIKKQLDIIAELKFNTAVIFDWNYFKLNQDDYRSKFKEIFNYARERFIEPIPDLGCFGSDGPLLTKAPEAAEGIYVEDEHFRFINGEVIPIKKTKHSLVNVIRTEESDIIIKDLSSTNIYYEDVDYKVIDGIISYPYSLNNKPTRIIRLPEGEIKDGEEVLISYDYVENKCASWAPWSIPYCPSSNRTYKVIFDTIDEVIKLLKPNYISLGHSEIRGMNRDSRCKKRKLSNAQLLSESLNKISIFVKDKDSKIKLIIWDDMINPWHNGGVEDYQVNFGGPFGRTDLAVDSISKDIIIAVWWYDESDWLQKMKRSPDYFEDKGFKYLVSPWKSKKNIQEWTKIAKERKGKCIGIIDTTWDGWFKNIEGIKYTAELSW